MSDDPETVRQIAELARDDRPLLVLDVDEVVLEFVQPFMRFLGAQGLHLKTDSFRLHGNVVHLETGAAIEPDRVSALLDEIFAAQHDWLTAAPGAAETVAGIAGHAEVVLLTAMPHQHRETRRTFLDRLGFPYPLVTTTTPKGPAIRQLRGERARAVAFVDDMPHNLASVRATIADAYLFHLMCHADFRALLPPLPDGVVSVECWPDAGPKIAAALGI